MKTLSFTLFAVLMLLSVSLKAQKKATQDNGTITVAQSQTTVGKNQQTHYKMTNNGTVSMDFSLYKQMTNGSWDVTHHLDLAPGQTYEDVNGYSGYNGKYVLYSAPHSDWASFPNTIEIAGLISNPATAPAPTPGAAPATNIAPSPAPQPAAPAAPAAQDPLKRNTNIPPPLPPL